jgi:hypothetical protein
MKCEGIDLIAWGRRIIRATKEHLPNPAWEQSALCKHMAGNWGHPAIASDAKLLHGWLEALLFL